MGMAGTGTSESLSTKGTVHFLLLTLDCCGEIWIGVLHLAEVDFVGIHGD